MLCLLHLEGSYQRHSPQDGRGIRLMKIYLNKKNAIRNKFLAYTARPEVRRLPCKQRMVIVSTEFGGISRAIKWVSKQSNLPEPVLPTMPIFSLGCIWHVIPFKTSGSSGRYLISTCWNFRSPLEGQESSGLLSSSWSSASDCVFWQGSYW